MSAPPLSILQKSPEVNGLPLSGTKEEMQFAVDVTVTRLVNKCKKEHIAALCAEFGISVSGTTQELAEKLAEQLRYETDSEHEDDDQGGDEGDDLEKAFALISVNELDDEGDDLEKAFALICVNELDDDDIEPAEGSAAKEASAPSQQDIDRPKADASLGKTVSAPSQQNPHSAFLKLIQMSCDALGDAVHGSKLIQLGEAYPMLHDVNFLNDGAVEPSVELAKLAEKFLAVGSGNKYIVPVGTKASNAVTKCNGWQSDGLEHCSKLFIDPVALFNWLTIARARGYTEARLVMHDMRSQKQNWHLLAANPFGFDFSFSPQNAKKWGFYAAPSDDIVSDYNALSELPSGSAILCLILIEKTSDHEMYKMETFSTLPRVDDVVIVREPSVCLPLGIVRAFDATHGWALAPTAYGQ